MGTVIQVVFVDIGACGIRLVCLFLQMTGLNRVVEASYGAQQQTNRRVEEAIVTYRHEESTRLAHAMPRKDSPMPQDETCTGSLCLIGIEPMSHYIVLEQAAPARDRAIPTYCQAFCGWANDSMRAGGNARTSWRNLSWPEREHAARRAVSRSTGDC